MNRNRVIQSEAETIVQTYARPEVVFRKGSGSYLYDSENKKYLDFMSGIAVNALGHSDPEWVHAVSEQAGRLVHVSNLYHTAPHVELAQKLVVHSFADRVFYCNSGSEANEGALKFARKYSQAGSGNQRLGKRNIVAFEGSFHGRTMGALAATHKARYREPFSPLVPGVSFAPFDDLEGAKKLINDDTCAVIVEPIQGEGGVNLADGTFLQGLRNLCDEVEALLIFDEVQCGLGRSGTLWAHEAYGVTPDIMTLAKTLAGGLPIGAILVTEDVAQVIEVGDHGSTFAAGPLVCRAAKVVFDRVNQPEFLKQVRDNGALLMDLLKELPDDQIVEIRGVGLLVGVEFNRAVAPIVSAARDNGLLVISAGEFVLRLCPPLIITDDQIRSAVATLGNII